MKKFYTILIVVLTVSITFEPIVSREIKRKKRDLATIVSIIAELAPPIYQIIRDFLKKEKCDKINKDMVNDLYNNNMENAQELKAAISEMMPEAGAAIHMKASGYYCDNSYCSEMGANVMGTLGICSKEYCVCKDGQAEVQKCGIWRLFDPMTGHCTWTWKAKLCH